MRPRLAIAATTLMLCGRVALGQPGSLEFEKVPYRMASGSFTHSAAGAAAEIVFSHTVEMTDSPFLRVHFGEARLGTASYLLLISRADGDRQTLNAHSLPIWSHSSAFFKGDAVDVELHVAPGDHNVFFEIEAVTVPIVSGASGSGGSSRTLCDSDDDRVISGDARVARLNFNCTAWFTINTAFMAAGHCDVAPGGLIEFNVPMSLANGMPQPAPADDQYPTLAGTISSQDEGIGDDWSVFGVGPNSNTGLLPWQAQGGFVRITRQTPGLGDTVRVTGYGVDHTPAGSGGLCCQSVEGNCVWDDCNSRNKTLQTDTGYFGAGTGTSHMYRVDTEPANSGSPILWEANGRAIGIHTTGSCSPFSGNQGTSFENTGLISALENFLENDAVYVDAASLGNSGSVFSPYSNLVSASVFAPSGATIHFVAGSYSGGATFARPATLKAPIGTARLGQ